MMDIRIHTGWGAGGGGGDGDISLHSQHHALPSPTLTNPDMVLPTYGSYGATTSPPRQRRPPSPSYLRDKTNQVANAHAALTVSSKGSKRSLTTPTATHWSNQAGVPIGSARTTPDDDNHFADFDRSYTNTPSTMDNRSLLAPASIDEKRLSSGSSFNSDDFAEARRFLSRYPDKAEDSTTLDNESLLEQDETPKRRRYDRSPQLESEMEARRKVQEQEEQNSAMLSQRAEMILANAKKRLNLMEGNLRGARDLVAAPLTAANLKRATSLGSAHMSQSSVSSRGGRFTSSGLHAEPDSVPRYRILHSQASSPTMGREYRMSQAYGNQSYLPAHNRGWSEELPERPATSLSKRSSTSKNGRFPVKINSADASANGPNQSLRGSRSQDTLSRSYAYQRPSSREHARGKASPDPNLDTLLEDQSTTYSDYDQAGYRHYDASNYDGQPTGSVRGLGLYRSASAADDLRSQMTNLKGKISTLKDRAKEDSLRRASIQNLRNPSPLNNAAHTAPEMFYMSSPTIGNGQLDPSSGYGWNAHANRSSANLLRPLQQNAIDMPLDGNNSRKSLRASLQQNHLQGGEAQQRPGRNGRQSAEQQTGSQGWQPMLRNNVISTPDQPRTAGPGASAKPYFSNSPLLDQGDSSGNDADIESSDDTPRLIQQADLEEEMEDELDDDDDASYIEDSGTEDGNSVYQDAPAEQPAPVAHEDREDAFDYQHFFLHSAMAAYGIKEDDSDSNASDASTETARGPTIADLDDDDGADENEDSPPQTPDVREKVQHKRSMSSNSVSTVDTFATAVEDRDSPSPTHDHRTDWPIANTAIAASSPEKHSSSRSENGSDRADSGVGLSRRSVESQPSRDSPTRTKQQQRSSTTTTKYATSVSNALLKDPATIAVTTIMDPNLGQLGLKDKSALFGVVESLRRWTRTLQECDEASPDAQAQRHKLDEIQRILDA